VEAYHLDSNKIPVSSPNPQNMKIATIIGARPQFIKAAAVSRSIAEYNEKLHSNQSPMTQHPSPIDEVVIHTGQHYDDGMSAIFFRELEIPEPDYNLNIGSGSHGLQTGQMLIAIEDVLIKQKPDWVLIYGDTNSTLAGALAAAKLHIPIAHVEAGLRSFNRLMPEEVNRVVADQLSDLLFCPSQVAFDNLAAEGISLPLTPHVSHFKPHVVITGDVMADSLQFAAKKASTNSDILTHLELQPKGYLLATIHRAENTDDLDRLGNIIEALSDLAEKEFVVLPIHPRTRKILNDNFALRLTPHPSLKIIDPVGYFDIIALEKSARIILTDSGGMQKEAYWLKVPCITLRDETEWIETVEMGWNILTGADHDKIIVAVRTFKTPSEHPPLYGDGNAAERIVKILAEKS
jgi:UDP-GlcNAc3NAcA epimerase